MKRGREEEKVMGPLFPRLHVNDTDKGGPRAPPRNKMALYEQFSIPSQRFNSGTARSLPLLPHQAGSLVPSASSSQGCGHERSVFSPFHVPSHKAPHATEKIHSCSTDGLNPTAMRTRLEKKSQKHVSQRMVNSAGNEQAGAECSSLRPRGLSSAKESSGRLEGEDDFRVPTFVLPGTTQHSEKVRHLMNREIRTRFHSDSLQKNGQTTLKTPIRVQNSDVKSLERRTTTVSLSRQHARGSGEGKAKEVTMHTKSTENMSHLASIEKAVKPSNLSKTSSNQECLCGKSNELYPSHSGTANVHQEPSGTFQRPRHLNDAEVMKKPDMLKGTPGSYSQMPLGNGLRGPCVAENYNASSEAKAAAMGKSVDRNGSSGDADKITVSGDGTKHTSLRDADRNDDTSETSMVDSISGVGISPDDVVDVIGPKHFWKARRAIVNQQRVFALQVFELHRLIKVQKLIAASPHLLLEDDSYLRGSPPKAPVKDPPSNSFVRPQQHINKDEEESCQVNRNSECPEENMAGIPSLHPEDGNSKGPVIQLQGNGFCSENPSSVPVASDNNKPGSWSFQLPGNQWLIPVMSPTEGLIYKPYTGPCPPPGAFMAPVCGGCSALSVPLGAGDFISPAYGVPTSHHQQNMGVLPSAPAVTQNFFPAPFGLPVVNPLISSSAVEHVSSLAEPWCSDQKEQQSRSSCSMSNPRSEALSVCARKVRTAKHSEALSVCARKVRTAKDSDLQASTASSPGERAQRRRDARSPFPMASAMDYPGHPPPSHCRDHQSHVIKVVPHNPRTATESAARIFQSIQKERQRNDSV